MASAGRPQCRGRQEGARFRGASRSPSKTSPSSESPGRGQRRQLLRGRGREDLFIRRRLANRWARAPRSRTRDRSASGKRLASAAAPASLGPGSRGWSGSPPADRWRPRSAFGPRSDRIGIGSASSTPMRSPSRKSMPAVCEPVPTTPTGEESLNNTYGIIPSALNVLPRAERLQRLRLTTSFL
jgi:hypothetical protein